MAIVSVLAAQALFFSGVSQAQADKHAAHRKAMQAEPIAEDAASVELHNMELLDRDGEAVRFVDDVMGDRIVVMSKGKVMQIGTPQEVYHDSANTFVASFLGSPGMNFIEMKNFLVGFRPEQFIPQELAEQKDNLQIFHFTVKRVEYLGAEQQVYGVVEGSTEEKRVIANLSSEMHVKIEPGETYNFAVRKQQLRFFDKETGLRIDPQPL